MKLRYSPTSPYVRKVTVTLHELGLDGQVELLPTNPWDLSSDLQRVNPLNKVPTLLLDDGSVLYDSPVVCEYLDAQARGGLFPAPPARWQVLRRQALADGVLDAAVAVFLETRRRADDERSAWWLEVQNLTLDRSLQAMAEDAAGFGEPITIDQVACGCALGYLDFRFPELDWRARHAALDDWYAGFGQRDSMRATVPRDPT